VQDEAEDEMMMGTLSDDELIANRLMGTGNYSATSKHVKLVHWPLMGGMIHLVQRGGDWTTASVPITVLLYSVTLLCGFNVPIKGLSLLHRTIYCLSCVSFSNSFIVTRRHIS